MTAGELTTIIFVFAIAGALLFLGVRSFLARGFLLNNAYLYASKEARRAMNKKPYYRQTAIIFCTLSAVFLVVGLSLLVHYDRILLLEIPLISGATVYAIVSSRKINAEKTTAR